MKTSVMSAVVALALAGPASAGAVLYDCTVKQTAGPRNWVSPRIAVVLQDGGTAQIIDSLTLQFETGPRQARVRKQGDSLRLTWAFEALTDRAGTMIPKFNFNASLNTKTGAFKVRGKPVRFPQSVRGNGACQVRKDLSAKQLKSLLRG